MNRSRLAIYPFYYQDKYYNMGQATWYSSYMCIIYPLGVIAYWIADKPWKRIVFGIFSAASFMLDRHTTEKTRFLTSNNQQLLRKNQLKDSAGYGSICR